MHAIREAQVKAEAALLDAITNIADNGLTTADKTKIHLAVDAITDHAALTTMAKLRQAAECVLTDRLAK